MKKLIWLLSFFLLILCFSCLFDNEEAGNYGANGLDYDVAANKWGFMDKNGTAIIQHQYDEAQDFKEGLAAVRIKDKWGYINKQGALVIPLQFKSCLLYTSPSPRDRG